MKYPLFKVHIDKKPALKLMSEVLDSGFINEGVQVTQLTEAMQERFKTKQLVLVNSCTSALTLALRLCNVKRHDEVVTTAMTCVATNCPIATMGSIVSWADIDPETGCIDVDSVKRTLEQNPNVKNDQIVPNSTATKAVIAVAWAGNPPNLRALRDLCDQFNVKLILDAAHAFGATYQGSDISNLPDFTCYSFQAIKHITTGDGGMLICKSEDDWRLAKQLKWFGIDRDAAKDAEGNWRGQHWDFDVIHAGFKFNMNNLTAALGLSQLPHIDRIITKHRNNALVYDAAFRNSQYVVSLKVPSHSQSSHWVYTILLKEEHKMIRDDLLRQLNSEGIGAGLVHVPNDDYSCFSESRIDLPGVRSFSSRQLSLPVGWWLKESHIKKIAKRVNQLCKELSK